MVGMIVPHDEQPAVVIAGAQKPPAAFLTPRVIEGGYATRSGSNPGLSCPLELLNILRTNMV
jgi:hypothetical protein